MKFKLIILIFLLYIPSSILAMYFTGLSLFSFRQGCFCNGFCLVGYDRRLILVGLEIVPALMLYRCLIRYELKKSILLALLTGFVLESFLANLLSAFGILFFDNRFVIRGISFPIYMAVDRLFYIGIIYGVVISLLRSRLKEVKRK